MLGEVSYRKWYSCSWMCDSLKIHLMGTSSSGYARDKSQPKNVSQSMGLPLSILSQNSTRVLKFIVFKIIINVTKADIGLVES